MAVYDDDFPRFIYSQLGPYQDAIRLVTVEPCFESTDQIICTLHNARISANDGYTAVSYMWGPFSDGHSTIVLDGTDFPVRANLWNFLRYAQTTLPGRYLWIDAICIDQTETQERIHQVKIMGDIYSSASRVVAWLGEGNPELNSIFEDLQHQQASYKLLPSSRESVRFVPDQQKNLYSHRRLPAELSYLSWIHPRLVHFLLWAYWQRTWIVQEILLAKRLSFACGSRTLDCNVLMEAMTAFHQTSIMDEKVAIRKLTLWQRRSRLRSGGTSPTNQLPSSLRLLLQRSDPHHQVHDLKMENMVDTMRETECLDPRDRIFGSLSLVSMGRTFAIDYNQPVSNLVLQVLQYFGGNLDFLERVIACLRTNPLEVCLKALEFLSESFQEPCFPIAPVVAFETSNACCCADRARFAHSDYSETDFLLSIPATEHRERLSNIPYSRCRNNRDCLTLCLKCIGGRSFELLTSGQVTCSTYDHDQNFKESCLISFDGPVPEDSFVVRGNVAFTRPEEGVTRYFMTTTMFVELMNFRILHVNYPVSQKKIARMTSPTTDAVFLGRFTGGLPAQDTKFKYGTLASLPSDSTRSELLQFMSASMPMDETLLDSWSESFEQLHISP